jgi:RHS repeat-associated protein
LNERLYVQQDANGNVTALVDTSGNVQERYVYDPFGAVTILAPNWTTRGSSSFAWIYLHQAGRFDTATGLYNFRNRDYSPALGRWMQVDPLGLAPDSNAYRYVGNGPTGANDPSGLSPAMEGSSGGAPSWEASNPVWTPGDTATVDWTNPTGQAGGGSGDALWMAPIFSVSIAVQDGSAAAALDDIAEPTLRRLRPRGFGRGGRGLSDPAGFARGLGVGLADGGLGFFEGLGKLGWALIRHPIDTPKEMYSGIKGLIQEIRAGELSDVAKELFPDLYDLAHNWDRNTDEYNGYLIGKIVGNYGASILTPMGAAKIVQMLKAAKAAKLASKVGSGSSALRLASGMGEGARPMTVVRSIGRGERVADIIREVKQLTFTSGNEHAVVTLADGSRAIVSGGPGGITFAQGQITRLFGHSHPYQLPATGPSAADLNALQILGQRSSYLLEHGQLIQFSR